MGQEAEAIGLFSRVFYRGTDGLRSLVLSGTIEAPGDATDVPVALPAL